MSIALPRMMLSTIFGLAVTIFDALTVHVCGLTLLGKHFKNIGFVLAIQQIQRDSNVFVVTEKWHEKVFRASIVWKFNGKPLFIISLFLTFFCLGIISHDTLIDNRVHQTPLL